ncbi:MAG: Asp-tRNA(Asn)/Glu-tRNA(Gln) amidotransferase subunit GatC [Planctomycetota bacterium]
MQPRCGERGPPIVSDDSVPADPGRPVVDSELVKKTARLARLELTDEEVPALVHHMERILDLVDILRSVEIPADLETQSEARTETVSCLRRDESVGDDDPGGPRDADSIGKNAPDWRDGTFVTPRVLG